MSPRRAYWFVLGTIIIPILALTRNQTQAWIKSLPPDKQILPFVIVVPIFIIGSLLFFIYVSRRDFKKLREIEDKEMTDKDNEGNS
jgi:hypothetical protein